LTRAKARPNSTPRPRVATDSASRDTGPWAACISANIFSKVRSDGSSGLSCIMPPKLRVIASHSHLPASMAPPVFAVDRKRVRVNQSK
jgi:hypothetical protein